jgi:hypothetical protein
LTNKNFAPIMYWLNIFYHVLLANLSFVSFKKISFDIDLFYIDKKNMEIQFNSILFLVKQLIYFFLLKLHMEFFFFCGTVWYIGTKFRPSLTVINFCWETRGGIQSEFSLNWFFCHKRELGIKLFTILFFFIIIILNYTRKFNSTPLT